MGIIRDRNTIHSTLITKRRIRHHIIKRLQHPLSRNTIDKQFYKLKNVQDTIQNLDRCKSQKRSLVQHSQFKIFSSDKRVGGIEPPSLAWKARVLPLNYTRAFAHH
jgi:hypothetical protein